MDTPKTHTAVTRDLTTAEMIAMEGGRKPVLPTEPIDLIGPIVITPVIDPIVAELDTLTP